MKDAKELSEDDQKRVEQEIDKLVGEFQTKIDETFKTKEQAILKV